MVRNLTWLLSVYTIVYFWVHQFIIINFVNCFNKTLYEHLSCFNQLNVLINFWLIFNLLLWEIFNMEKRTCLWTSLYLDASDEVELQWKEFSYRKLCYSSSVFDVPQRPQDNFRPRLNNWREPEKNYLTIADWKAFLLCTTNEFY